MTIDLAPGHKLGLVVENPLLLGAGSVGLGDNLHPELELAAVGAVIVGPVTAQGRAGAPPPRLAQLPGGMVLNVGAQNRGIDATLKHAGRLWARMGTPVVVQVAEWSATLVRLAERLSHAAGIAGLELLLPPDQTAAQTAASCERLAQAADLPFWVKLPACPPEAMAGHVQAAASSGASALVIAQPPLGSAPAWPGGPLVTGALFGPAIFAQTLYALAAVAALKPGLPLIASGGIHTLEQARAALSVGASAVQVDALAWIEPAEVGSMARLLAMA
jgi:dihydroorotate dehydrogenase (NAD+) catalytic subunit